jgi:heme oxygenase
MMNASSSAAPGADVLERIRSATTKRHDTLDRRMPLSVEEPTLADYRDHLVLLAAWLGPIEAWFSRFDDGPQSAAVLAPLARLPLIADDLADPRIPQGGLHIDPITLPSPSMQPDSAYRWGVSYVVEGSQLGGAVLYRRLAASLAPHPLAYLRGIDGAPGPRWQQFIRALRTNVLSEDEIDRACMGACDAFDSLIALLPAHA